MITKNTPLKDIIPKIDPCWDDIADITVGELRKRMQQGEDYYRICDVDSDIRERHFDAIAEAFDIEYDVVYQKRLHNDEQPTYIRK